MGDGRAAHEVPPLRTSAAGALLTVYACTTVDSPLECNIFEDSCPWRGEDGPKAVPPLSLLSLSAAPGADPIAFADVVMSPSPPMEHAVSMRCSTTVTLFWPRVDSGGLTCGSSSVSWNFLGGGTGSGDGAVTA